MRSIRSMAFLAAACSVLLNAQAPATFEYRVLATTRTSTAEREMNAAADGGYYFGGLMGGKEVLVVMTKAAGQAASGSGRTYKLLATSRTGTMEKELQQAGDAGFSFRDITVFKSEVVVVLEKVTDQPQNRFQYKLLATSRTGTMQKELLAAGSEGFRFRGLAFGKEVLSILERPAK